MLRLKPDDRDALLYLGHGLNHAGDADGAVAAFRECARLDPNDPTPHRYIGQVLLRYKRDQEGAMTELQEAVRLKPDDADCHNELGGLLAFCGRLDEGIAEFREALRLNPHCAEAQTNLARAIGVKSAAS